MLKPSSYSAPASFSEVVVTSPARNLRREAIENGSSSNILANHHHHHSSSSTTKSGTRRRRASELHVPPPPLPSNNIYTNNNRVNTTIIEDENHQSSTSITRGIPRRKLMVMNILQHQLAETRQQRLCEQQQEYAKKHTNNTQHNHHQQQHQRNNNNHSIVMDQDEKQCVDDDMFSELKCFLNTEQASTSSSVLHLPHVNTNPNHYQQHNQNISSPPPTMLYQYFQSPLSPKSINPTTCCQQSFPSSTPSHHLNHSIHNNIIEPIPPPQLPLISKPPILPFNIELDLKKQQQQTEKKSKEYCAKILGVPCNYTISDIHDLVLDRCSIICNHISIEEKKGKRIAILNMKSKKEAQEVKRNIEGIKVELHELKVRVTTIKKKRAANGENRK